MLTPGTKAPDFALPDDRNETVSLAGLLKSGPLILYFYPADFTPGCTREACGIRDSHAALSAAGLQVVGVSPQNPASHRRFREQHELPFRLLADPDKTVIRQYDAAGPLGLGVRRVTYLIAPDGVIRDAVRADIRIGRHRAFIENAARSRRTMAEQ